jgi:hypothetical protein
MKPEQFKSWAIVIGSALVIIGTSGGDALTVLAGVPRLVQAFATDLPGGLWSFLLAALVSAGLHFWVRTWSGRSFLLELAVLVAAVAVCMVLTPSAAAASARILAAVVGVLAGLCGLLTSKAVVAAREAGAARSARRCPPEDAP